jgi:predicted amidohydrolase
VERKENLDRLIPFYRKAVADGAQIVATVEGCLDGYPTKELPKRRLQSGLPQKTVRSAAYKKRFAAFKKKQLALADRIKSDCLPALIEETKSLGVYLFVNTLDRRRGESVYNTTFVINPKGKVIGKYDKIHAAFETGNICGKTYSIFETDYGPIGVLICADRNYPETSRILNVSGAGLHIINSYGFWGEGKNDVTLKQRARENGSYIVFIHPNETVFFSPEGRVIASSSSWENILIREIDLTHAGRRATRTLTIPDGLVKRFSG